jgi:hypothetical protein
MVLAAAVSYQFFDEDKNNFVMPVWIGPALFKRTINIDYKQDYTTANGGGTKYQFDAELDGITPGIMIGTQTSFSIKETVRISFYANIIMSLADDCAEYTVDNVSLDNDRSITGGVSNYGCETSTASPTTAPVKVHAPRDVASLGVEFKYIPWDFSLNVSSQIRNIATPAKPEGTSITLLTMTKSWGEYIK